MSGRNFLEKLLDGVEVEWKALSSVVETVTAPSKLKGDSYRATGKLPIIDQGIEFIAGYTDEDVTPVEAGEYVIFGDHSEHIKYVDFPFVQGADGLKILRPISVNAKYIYHAFLNFYTKELNYKRHWSTAQQTVIPIPCPDNPKKSLEIQAEIVRILDCFTKLTAELTAELTARKKQYNYYRDQLLSFEDDEVEWKTLGDVAEVRSGWGFPNAYQGHDGGPYPFYKVSDMNIVGNETTMQKANNYVDAETIRKLGVKPAPVGTVIFPKIGAAVATNKKRLLSVPSAYDNNVMGVIPGSEIIDRFLFYWIQTFDLSSVANDSGAVPSIRKSEMEGVLIPIPPLAEQARIVAILDKFDALTNSITEGLPREIELRQKQYEYYRDLLLSFPKPETVSAARA